MLNVNIYGIFFFFFFVDTMNMLLTCLLFGLTEALVINENVVFHKENEVSITRSKWLFTFVIDLNPYENFLLSLALDTEKAAIVARNLIQIYDKPRREGFLNSFCGLQKQIKDLQVDRQQLINSYVEINSIKSRSKRSLIPIIGKALHFLFGTLTSADLSKIRRNIKTLANNQKDMLHVLEDSISILNTSRIQISENRQTINNLSISINSINERIENATKILQKEYIELEQFVQMYLQLDLVIEETKRTVSNAQMYMEHLQLQLNMLSLGHLSPSVITPKNLKHLLIDMSSKLPHHLTLPDDPDEGLWKYYQSLTCTTILDKSMFLVVVNLPLIDRDHKFEIYQIINSPLPYHDPKLDAEQQPKFSARYKLESMALAINPEKTNYMILDQVELAHCSTPLLDYCKVKSSSFPVNLSKLCIVALFMKNKENVGKYCKTEVTLNSLLPKATYVFDGIWVIATQTELTFSIVCSDYTKIDKVKPPMSVMSLEMGCSASNDYVTLMPYYHKESTYVTTDIYSELLRLNNKTEFKIWDPFTYKLPNFASIEVPKELQALEKIPMGHLIDRLHNT